MIRIQNIEKIYYSKKGNDQVALKSVSIDFPEKGFVFIVGKSGSGKSTLMNLMGGLDSATSGEIIVNGKSSKDFTLRDYDAYRNLFVGFVFQEFNIIEDLTVMENVSIPLEFQDYPKDEIDEKVQKVLNDLEIGDLAHRKINELSGGQIQRIAIARALIKDPEIILADEPTGNLDSETSTSVLNLLKELSKEKLVVMVTHELEFAQQYGDRIIELADGEIFNDHIINLVGDHQTEEYEEEVEILELDERDTKEIEYSEEMVFEARSARFPFISMLQLAIKNLFSYKFRLLLTTLVLIMTLCILSFTIVVARYDTDYSTSKTFDISETDYYTLQHCSGDMSFGRIIECLDFTDYGDLLITNNQVNELVTEGVELYGKLDYYSESVPPEPSEFGILIPYSPEYVYEPLAYNDKIAVTEDSHYEYLYGITPTAPHEVAITDFLAEFLVTRQYYINVYGEITSEELLGKQLLMPNGEYMVVSGIIKTDYKRFEHLFEWPIDYQMQKDEVEEFAYYTYIRDTRYTSIYLAKEHMISSYSYSFRAIAQNYRRPTLSMKNFDTYRDYYVQGEIHYIDGYNGLDEGEFVTPASMLDEYFAITYEEMNEIKEDFSLALDYLGETYKFRSIDPNIGGIGDEIQTYTLVGIVDDTESAYYRYNRFYAYPDMFVPKSQMDKVNANELPFTRVQVYFPGDLESNQEFLKVIAEKNFVHATPASIILYTFAQTSEDILPGLIGATAGFAVFTIMLIVSFISFSITNRTKDIGILRALGTKGKDVSKIFLLEAIIIGAFSVIVSTVIVYFGAEMLNQQMSQGFGMMLYLYNVKVLEVLLILGFTLLVVTVAAIVPTVRISRKKPIDAIRRK